MNRINVETADFATNIHGDAAKLSAIYLASVWSGYTEAELAKYVITDIDQVTTELKKWGQKVLKNATK